MTNQVTDIKFEPKYFVHTDQMSGFKSDNKKDVLVQGIKGSLLLSDFKPDILICVYKIFWPKFSICDLICHVYIFFELIYNILHNKIQIWTFDSDNRIDLLWEFNYTSPIRPTLWQCLLPPHII